MDFRRSLLTIFGLSSLGYWSNVLVWLALSLFIFIIPQEFRSLSAIILLIVLFPISLAFIISQRKLRCIQPEIIIDKLLIILFIFSFDFFSQDIVRIGLVLILLIFSSIIHFFEYDILEDSAASILVKMTVIIIITMLITLSANLALTLYALSQYGM